MASWRQSLLARVVTMILLLWTAADLTNSSLCALENEDPTSVGPAVPSLTAADVDSSSQYPSQPARPHVDDCFCCSHCVDIQVFVPTLASAPITRDLQPLVVAVPRNFGTGLYHPPLVSLQNLN